MMVNQVMSEQIIKGRGNLLPLTSYLSPLRVENVKHAKLELNKISEIFVSPLFLYFKNTE